MTSRHSPAVGAAGTFDSLDEGRGVQHSPPSSSADPAAENGTTTAAEAPMPIPAAAGWNRAYPKAPLHYGHEGGLAHLRFLPWEREGMPANAINAKPAWPVIIFMHGAGEIGTSLDFLFEALGAEGALPQLATLTPDVARRQHPSDPYRWAVAERALREYILLAPLSQAGWDDTETAAVVTMLDELAKTLPIDARRVIVTGVSMGGWGAMQVVSRRPDRFAGVAAVCGVASGDTCAAYTTHDVKVLVAHGPNDLVVPVRASDALVAACRAANTTVEYLRFEAAADPLDAPGNGHASWRNTYCDERFWAWCAAAQRPA